VDKEWMKANTLSGEKPFHWSYDGENIVVRKNVRNNDVWNEMEICYTNSEIVMLISYIKQKRRVALANSVSKLQDGTEKEGIGNYIYNNIEKNISKAQSASQLVAILHDVNVLGFNGAKRNMEFWVNDIHWRERILGYMK
jgi:hypothetical protein